MSSIELPRCAEATSDEEMWQEFALDDDIILADLVTCNSPSLHSTDLLSPLTPLPPLPSSSALVGSSNSVQDDGAAMANKRTIAMQSLLVAEDDLVTALHVALSLCNDNDRAALACHISPSIQEQLSGSYNPSPLLIPSDENSPNSPLPSPTKHPWPQLAKFEAQRKEKCHQSHGIH